MADHDHNPSSNQHLDHPSVTTTTLRHRQTTSLVLPRTDDSRGGFKLPDASILARAPHGSSFSFWRPNRKPQRSDYDPINHDTQQEEFEFGNYRVLNRKHGVKNWKPLRAIAHMIRMRHVGCLFSVETVAVNGLPASANGIRVAVVVRKEGSKDGAVQTLPCRVTNGRADFDETLYVKCRLYFTGGGGGTGKPVRFESKLFVISVVAIDAPRMDFGEGYVVDLSSLVVESVDSSLRGNRVRNWEKTIPLRGKAAGGGELVVKLSFQIMQSGGGGGGGFGIFGTESYELPRKQTKSSFSVPSRRVGRTESDLTHLRHDSPRSNLNPELITDTVSEDFRFPEFDVIYKGTENSANEESSEDAQSKKSSLSGEVVKEIVINHRSRNDMLLELDLIDKEIKALESRMINNPADELVKNEILTPRTAEIERERRVLIPDLGKGLGPAIRTRDGGFLVAMNPFNSDVAIASGGEEVPRIVMQVSRPFVLRTEKVSSGFEVFQRIAAVGSRELESGLVSWAKMDGLEGKSAEQIVYEGVASFIVRGRNNKEAQSVRILKKMAESLVEGRRQRILTGIWNVAENDPSDVEEILAFCVQKIESMAVDALKIQANVSEERAPFGISRIVEKNARNCIFDALVPAEPENYPISDISENRIFILYGVVLRDPSRGHEIIGGPMIAAVQATKPNLDGGFRVTNLHLGGLRSRLAGEKQRLTALQWLVANGFVRKRIERCLPAKGAESVVWSVSTRVVADMWLKTARNPDVTVVNSD